MKHALLLAGFVTLSLLPWAAEAATYPVITYHDQHHLFVIDPNKQATWKTTQVGWMLDGHVLDLPANTLEQSLPASVQKTEQVTWNREAIAAVLRERIASKHDRAAGNVIIRTATGGKVVFEGVGMRGRTVKIDALVTLTITAIENGVDRVTIPITETEPSITVADPALAAMGIKELVTVGESDYSNSPRNRIHNIKVGMARFNGHLIPKDTTFSFVGVLGPVDGSTGYLKELVIKGDKTEPDYGGGLCQISSTAYRGVWEYGFPIVQRKNHSFAVSHYLPQGTDATIYPPSVDMKFMNDSPGALLMQTYLDEERELAYYLYYGTKDDRKAEIIGPYTWDHVGPPPERTEYTTDLAPGARRKVGDPVAGLKSQWFRLVQMPGQAEKVEVVFSHYQARPRYYQVGVTSIFPEGTDTSDLGDEIPAWISD